MESGSITGGLIMLRKAPDKHPYLAAWIANTVMMTANSGEK